MIPCLLSGNRAGLDLFGDRFYVERSNLFRNGDIVIELYSWPTPNGHKIHVMLEETGLEYRVHPVNIGDGDQFKPEFLAISPNNKIPAIIDPDGPDGKEISVFETGAILIYLARKSGKFLPSETDDPVGHYDTLQWLMFQMGGIGPMFGQAHHFNSAAQERVPVEQVQYSIDRYVNECQRLYGVLDRQLEGREWIAAGQYTIADIAIMTWTRFPKNQGVDIDAFSEVKRWRDAIMARPQVQRAFEVLADTRKRLETNSDKQWEIMYGKTQAKQGEQG